MRSSIADVNAAFDELERLQKKKGGDFLDTIDGAMKLLGAIKGFMKTESNREALMHSVRSCTDTYVDFTMYRNNNSINYVERSEKNMADTIDAIKAARAKKAAKTRK